MIHRWRMQRILLVYREGGLSSQRRQAIAGHLERCEICRETLQRWADTDLLLQQATAFTPRLSHERADMLFQRALAQAGSRSHRPALFRFPLFGGVALASALALGCVWLGLVSAARTDRKLPAATLSVQAARQSPSPASAPALEDLSCDMPALADEMSSRISAPRLVSESQRHSLPMRSRQPHSCLQNDAADPALMDRLEAQEVRLLSVADNKDPQISLTVTYESIKAQGFASVSCRQPDENGVDAWANCTISSTPEASSRVLRIQSSSRAEKSQSLLRVTLTDSPRSEVSGDKP